MRPRYHDTARLVRAFGEVKSICLWAKDERCFLTRTGLAFRINRFERELTEKDAEAAMCLTTRMWQYYRLHGTVPPEVLDDELGPLE
jgi:hypothetical protein